MCDGCGEIFSENAEGWATQNASINKRDEKGRMITVSAQLDKCPNCAEMEMNRSNVSMSYRTMLTAQPHYVEDETP